MGLRSPWKSLTANLETSNDGYENTIAELNSQLANEMENISLLCADIKSLQQENVPWYLALL